MQTVTPELVSHTMTELARSDPILIVDDEVDLCRLLAFNLNEAGFAAEVVHTGTEALQSLEKRRPLVVVLDLMLPDLSGKEVCRQIRGDPANSDIGVLMLTARGDELDRVIGLELGADDYVAKPFEPRELLARVKSVLRRVQAPAVEPADDVPAPPVPVPVGDCRLEMTSRRLFDATGAEIALTAMEFDLLRTFVERPNTVLTRDQLLDLTRHLDWEPFDRSIDIRIARLRRKIEPDAEKPQAIRTIRGSGYMFVPARA